MAGHGDHQPSTENRIEQEMGLIFDGYEARSRWRSSLPSLEVDQADPPILVITVAEPAE